MKVRHHLNGDLGILGKQHLTAKAQRSLRRKTSFGNGHVDYGRRQHWKGHAGTYRDSDVFLFPEPEFDEKSSAYLGDEFQVLRYPSGRAPKYSEGRNPTTHNYSANSPRSIKSALDLKEAVTSVSSGWMNHDQYHNLDGITRERLRKIQSSRDSQDYSRRQAMRKETYRSRM